MGRKKKEAVAVAVAEEAPKKEKKTAKKAKKGETIRVVKTLEQIEKILEQSINPIFLMLFNITNSMMTPWKK